MDGRAKNRRVEIPVTRTGIGVRLSTRAKIGGWARQTRPQPADQRYESAYLPGARTGRRNS